MKNQEVIEHIVQWLKTYAKKNQMNGFVIGISGGIDSALTSTLCAKTCLDCGKKENKLGMRASETAELVFDQCRIPDANRLGPIGDGFIQSMKILDGGRISIAALSLGIARGAYEASLKYSCERVQFGKPINAFQVEDGDVQLVSP